VELARPSETEQKTAPLRGGQGAASADISKSSSPDEQKQEQAEHNRTYAPHAEQESQNWAVAERDFWQKPDKHWTDTPLGRAGIEFASRITLGGMFFALMGASDSAKKLQDYDPKSYQQHRAEGGKNTWLEHIAYGIDRTIGVAMKRTLTACYGGDDAAIAKADAALRFRETRKHNKLNVPGRSLGAEMTIVTADFAAMSVGSGIMRQVFMGALNPSERKAWLKDGSFDLGHTVKRLASKAWEILSYNAGEDMAVAAFYVPLMRSIRNLIDKVSPGFKYGSDRVDNGASIVVDDKGNIQSHQQIAGMADLQIRFTVYNVLTQLYRDGYNGVAQKLREWRDKHFVLSTPEFIKDPISIPERMVNTVKGTSRYLAISSIRSILQMTPSMPFFSLIRIPASKPMGLAVHPELGMMVFANDDGTPSDIKLRANQHKGDGTKYEEGYGFYSKRKVTFQNASILFKALDAKHNPFRDSAEGVSYNPLGQGKKGMPLQYDAVARATDAIGTTVRELADKPIWNKSQDWFWKITGHGADSKDMSKRAALAGMPYASYFAAKVFFRESFVNEQMNLAIGRMIDGVTSLNWKDFSEGWSEMNRTAFRMPFKEPNRQAELIENHRYHPKDKSPMPENWNTEKHKEYLKTSKQGNAPDTADLTAQISKERADDYAARAIEHKRQELEQKRNFSARRRNPSFVKQKESETGQENTALFA
jgi:hypothetical protein